MPPWFVVVLGVGGRAFVGLAGLGAVLAVVSEGGGFFVCCDYSILCHMGYVNSMQHFFKNNLTLAKYF